MPGRSIPCVRTGSCTAIENKGRGLANASTDHRIRSKPSNGLAYASTGQSVGNVSGDGISVIPLGQSVRPCVRAVASRSEARGQGRASHQIMMQTESKCKRLYLQNKLPVR
eukprot:3326566-Rhodomonas_salina.1